MTGSVKRRPYASAIRARRAEATRQRVLGAARRSFRERGYGATTVEHIATLARVAPATVYLVFGSKRGILMSLVAAVGTRAKAAQLNAAILAEPVLRRRLELAAKITRVITEDAWDVMKAISAGAAMDPDLAEAWRRGEAGRHQAVERAILPLASTAARSGLSADAVVDLVWALTGPDLYRALVIERGWSPQRYEKVLSQLLVAGVLPRESGRPSSPPKRSARAASSR